MDELEYYLPDDIPPEVLTYEAEIKQLGVGKTGKLGALKLVLERDGPNGKTCIKEQYSKVPLFTQRALYYDEGLPSMAYIYVMSPSGGVLQGDRYRMDISLRNKALSHITTQGATRLYRMNANFATQIINVTVDDGCYFEFIPDQIIPYIDSRFYQKINLKVHDNGTMIYSEVVVPGRVAMNESFEYAILYLKTIAKNQDNKLRFVDIAMLEPKKQNQQKLGILGEKSVVGTVYLLTKKEKVGKLNEQINLLLDKAQKVRGGSSILPYESGLVVRMLGDVANDIREVIFDIVRITRKHILNARFDGIRKC